MIGTQIRTMREDVGVSRAELARAAGIDRAHLSRIEPGLAAASLEVLMSIGAALGADLGVRFFPGSGPRIRDRFQAPMIEALVRLVDPSWSAQPEVAVGRPPRGFIDLVLRRDDETIATEAQSALHRLEQQLRWLAEKAAALDAGAVDGHVASRLLLLRSTHENRELSRLYEATLRAAYPASCCDAYDALVRPDRPWPGDALLWVRLEAGQATVLRNPPRGVRLGR